MVQAINNGGDRDWASEALSLILFVHLTMAEDADKRLASAGLNRTHHRILFLVDHKSGVTVGEIVNLLRLTAQAIQPPLRTLIDNQLIKQQSSERDRRKRHLIITKHGKTFLNTIASGQFARLAEARRRVGADSFEDFLRVMRAMTTESDREWLYPRDVRVGAGVEPETPVKQSELRIAPTRSSPDRHRRSRRPAA